MDSPTQYSTWYVALMAAGAIIAAPAGATGSAAFFLVGLGLVLIGTGEYISHPYRELHYRGGTIVGRPRALRLSGVVIDLIGLAIFARGLWSIVSKMQ